MSGKAFQGAVESVLPEFHGGQLDVVRAAIQQCQRRLQHAVTRTVLVRHLEKQGSRISENRLDELLRDLLSSGRIRCTGRCYWVQR